MRGLGGLDAVKWTETFNVNIPTAAYNVVPSPVFFHDNEPNVVAQVICQPAS